MKTEEPALYRCAHCGYDLRGLPTSTCPECGRDRWSVSMQLPAVPSFLKTVLWLLLASPLFAGLTVLVFMATRASGPLYASIGFFLAFTIANMFAAWLAALRFSRSFPKLHRKQVTLRLTPWLFALGCLINTPVGLVGFHAVVFELF